MHDVRGTDRATAVCGAQYRRGDAHQTDIAPKLSEVSQVAAFPEFMEQIVAKLLEKNPEDRFRDASEVRECLLEARAVSGAADYTQLLEPPKKTPTTAIALIALCILIVGLSAAVVFTMFEGNPKTATQSDTETSDKSGGLGMPLKVGDAMNDFTVDVKPLNNGNFVSLMGMESKLPAEKILDRFRFRKIRNIVALEAVGVPIYGNLIAEICNQPIKSMTFRDCTFGEDAFDQLSKVTRVESLRIESEALPDSAFENISKLPRLKDLLLLHCGIEIKHLKLLAPLRTTLQRLDLAWSAKVDRNCLDYLVTTFPELRELDVDRTAIRPEDYVLFAKAKKLNQISLCWMNVDDHALSLLPDMPQLRSLTFSGNKQITKNGLMSLARFRNLEFVGARDTSVAKSDLQELKSTLVKATVAIGNAQTWTQANF